MPELEIHHVNLVLVGISAEMQNIETSLALKQRTFFRVLCLISLLTYGESGRVFSDGELNHL